MTKSELDKLTTEELEEYLSKFELTIKKEKIMSGFDKVMEDWKELEQILTDEHDAPPLETIKYIFFSGALCSFRMAYAELENAETKDKAVENFSKTNNAFINFLYPR